MLEEDKYLVEYEYTSTLQIITLDKHRKLRESINLAKSESDFPASDRELNKLQLRLTNKLKALPICPAFVKMKLDLISQSSFCQCVHTTVY